MIGWLDCSSGCSGDMLLAALHGAGVPLEVMSSAVSELGVGLSLSRSEVTRAGLAAVKVDVVGADAPPVERHLSDILQLLDVLEPSLRNRAATVFGTLAHAEATVHGISVDEVHFHEVGALDALADVVGVCAGLSHLGLEELVASVPVVGSGGVRTAHGELSVPVPAVVEIFRLAGAPSVGEGRGELTTPTGAALLAVFVTSWGPQPALRVGAVGVGAGTKDVAERANVLRLLVGETAAQRDRMILETTVDDLEPRIWPHVIERLLAVGVDDAWVVPSIGKKDRIGAVLTVVCADAVADAAAEVVFAETTTLGLRRSHLLQRDVLDRDVVTVSVEGHDVRVKRGWLHGRVITAQPEWDDVAAVARATGIPARDVITRAQSSV